MRASRWSTPRQPEEEREIVDARVPLGEQIAFDALEAADQLVHQAAHLGEMPRDGQHLFAQAVLHRVADARGEARLQLRGGCRQRLDLLTCALERRVHGGGLDAAARGFLDPRLGAGDSFGVHRSDVTVAVGWISPSSTTTCRRS